MYALNRFSSNEKRLMQSAITCKTGLVLGYDEAMKQSKFK